MCIAPEKKCSKQTAHLWYRAETSFSFWNVLNNGNKSAVVLLFAVVVVVVSSSMYFNRAQLHFLRT